MKDSILLKCVLAAGIAVAAFTFGMGQAAANTIFNFNFSSASASGSGTLTAEDNGDGSFTAISGEGTEIFGSTPELLTLIFNPNGTANALSPTGAYIYDNQLLPLSNPMLLIGGLLFGTAGGAEINIWGTTANNYQFSRFQGSFNTLGDSTEFTLTRAVPEPGSITLLGLGLLGFVAIRRKLGKNTRN